MRIRCIDVTKSELVYAGFFSRLGAFVIDMILVTVVLLPIRLIYAFLTYITEFEILTTGQLFHFTVIDIFSYFMIALYFVLMTYFAGRTLGKMAVNIYVVSVKEENKCFWDILYRETIGRYLSSLLYIGYIMSAFHPQGAALHDRLCQTRVVVKVTAVEDITAEEKMPEPEKCLLEVSDAGTAGTESMEDTPAETEIETSDNNQEVIETEEWKCP